MKVRYLILLQKSIQGEIVIDDDEDDSKRQCGAQLGYAIHGDVFISVNFSCLLLF